MSGVVSLGYDYSSNTPKALSVDSNGKLDVDVELNTSGLATSAKQDTQQTSLNTLTGCVSGSEVQVDIVNTANVKFEDISSSLNSGTNNDPANSLAVGMRGRQTITDKDTETFCLVDAQGHLQVDIVSGGGGGGDASAANQTTMINSLSTIEGDTTSLDAKITACNTGAVVISSNSDTTKATSTLQTAGNTSLSNIDTATSSIQSNVSTSANQGTMITHLSEIEGAVETLEACVSSNELAVSRKDATHGNLTKNSVVSSSTGQTTAILNTEGYKSIIVIGRTDTTSSSCNLEFSDASDFAGGTDVIYNNDDTNIGIFTPIIFQSAISADAALTYNQAYARVQIPQQYMRIRVFNTSGSNRDYTFFYQLSN